jgi:hypothetical protein
MESITITTRNRWLIVRRLRKKGAYFKAVHILNDPIPRIITHMHEKGLVYLHQSTAIGGEFDNVVNLTDDGNLFYTRGIYDAIAWWGTIIAALTGIITVAQCH